MIDRVFREICRLLPEHGWFLSFDYVGPHRNQYSSEAWERAWEVNNLLPPDLRQVMKMAYPNLPIMVQVDPTEAVHSELIVDTLHRYFDVERFVPLGGAIAYPILTHNEALFALADNSEQTRWVQEVLQADREFLSEHPNSSLFAYIAAKPKKAVFEKPDVLADWEQEEHDREEGAQRNGGEYYPHTALQDAYIRVVAEAAESTQLRNRATVLQDQLDAIRRDWLYSRLTAVRGSRFFTAVRSAPLVRRLRGKLR